MDWEAEFERLCTIITERRTKRRNDFKEIVFEKKEIKAYRIYHCEYCKQYLVPLQNYFYYCLCNECLKRYTTRLNYKKNYKLCGQI